MASALLSILPTNPLSILLPMTPLGRAAHKKQTAQDRRLSVEHLFSRAIRTLQNAALSYRDGLTEEQREYARKTDERCHILALRMKSAETYQQWEAAAEELDEIEGNEGWRRDPSSGEYNPALIEARLQELDNARADCDIRLMLYLVRTALSRDLAGMGNIDLYRHSYLGTKELIECYVDSAVKTIEHLVEKSAYAMPEGLETRDILESLENARQSFGRSALLLSGGATFGMLHIGVVKSLWEAKLLPRIISGASAGSIVCAVLCTRTDEELPEMLDNFRNGPLDVFEPAGQEAGFLDHLRRLLTEGSWSDIENLRRVMQHWLRDMTFAEAYNKTRRILNICVSSASIYELPRLLNYITAPNVLIWSAVSASCSVPLVFSASPLLMKDPITGQRLPWNPTPQHWIDGSLDNDLPMTRLAEMFNVNHFIVSQVNAHITPFLARDDHLEPDLARNRRAPGPSAPNAQKDRSPGSSSTTQGDRVYALTALARDEMLHRLQFLVDMGIMPVFLTKLRSILSQRYSGDVTILPEITLSDLPRLLKNPSSEFMARSCLLGERATWPKLSRIRDRCAIELALDRAVHDLRARVVFSKSQVDLRRLVAAGPVSIDASALASSALPTLRVSPPYRMSGTHGFGAGAHRAPHSANPAIPASVFPEPPWRSAAKRDGLRHHHPIFRDRPHESRRNPRHCRSTSAGYVFPRSHHGDAAGGASRGTAQADEITDVDTEEEEREELMERTARTSLKYSEEVASYDAPPPQRLRRAARSHHNVLASHDQAFEHNHLLPNPLLRGAGPLTSPAPTSVARYEGDEFDFSRPLTPPWDPMRRASLPGVDLFQASRPGLAATSVDETSLLVDMEASGLRGVRG